MLLAIDIDAFLSILGKSLTSHFIRYIVAAGIMYSVFYLWKRRAWFYKKIQLRTPQKAKIKHEIFWSVISLIIISVCGSIAFYFVKQGYSPLYTDIAERGWLYLVLSTIGLIFWHDFYFYVTHRAMHHKAIFPIVHKIHHKSTDPTPWAAFSFHPIEAVVQFLFVPMAVFLVPLHPIALLTMGLFQITLNVIGHLGFEMFPKGFTTGKLTKWANTSTHHNMHHSKVNCNYGLYFNIWDRLLGTNHKDYDKTFEEVKSRVPSTEEKLAEQGLVKGAPKKQEKREPELV
jgi:sterol desaturase/sphingolipid hydroxylase (fatty acid hydroxylase superfamily)